MTSRWAPAWRCYAADTLKLKKVAMIDDRTAYGQGVAEVFKKTALSKGLQVVDEQFTTDKATDFMAILTAIKSKAPDAIFYGGMDAQAGPMLRQIEQLGLSNVKFFGGDGICTTEIIKLAAGAKTLDNVVCAEGGASLAKMPGGTAWKKRYDAKYPKPVPDLQPVHLRRHLRAGRCDEARQLGRPEGLHGRSWPKPTSRA